VLRAGCVPQVTLQLWAVESWSAYRTPLDLQFRSFLPFFTSHYGMDNE
jgi:hypothetical protein